MTVMEPAVPPLYRPAVRRPPTPVAPLRPSPPPWATGRLAELPPEVRRELSTVAIERSLSPAETVRWDRPVVIVMLSGRACVFMSSAERLAAVRYLDAGDMTGLALAFEDHLGPAEYPMVVRAITSCRVLLLPAHRLASLAQRDSRVAWKLGRWIVQDMAAGHQVLSKEIFLSVRELLAWHLLRLAVPDGSKLVVRARQQELADAIGSVRAVVGRAIVDLRREGLIGSEGRTITLLDPERLSRIAGANGVQVQARPL